MSKDVDTKAQRSPRFVLNCVFIYVFEQNFQITFSGKKKSFYSSQYLKTCTFSPLTKISDVVTGNVGMLVMVVTEHKEVEKAKRGREGEKLSWHEIQMMKYTWKVAQELMRIDPPVFGNFRLAERDINFDGYDIPKGWQVMYTY